MKYLIKKHNKEKVSAIVIRAITRLNDYKTKRLPDFSWNDKYMNY